MLFLMSVISGDFITRYHCVRFAEKIALICVHPLLSDLDEKAGAGFETTDAEDGVGEGGAHVGGAHAGDGHGSGNGDGGGGDCVGGANEDGPTPGTGGCFYLRDLRLRI